MSLGCAKILSATELERYRVRLERNLPVRGKKEFAPSGSWVERKQLEAARDERHALLKEERVERVGTLSVAEWDEKMNVAVVTYSIGKHWENFGYQEGQIKCLHPEEALFLLETSNLLLLHNNVGLSVQQGYNTLLGQRTGCTLNCYRVFSHLARQGFRLKRHSGPVFALTDYERRIGLQSYLYPSRRNILSVQGHANNDRGDSGNAEGNENTVRQITSSSEGNDNEMVTNYSNNQHADISSEGQVKTETSVPQPSEEKLFTTLSDEVICNTVKIEDTKLQKTREFGFCMNNAVADSTRILCDISETNFQSGKSNLSSPNPKSDISGSYQRTENSSEISVVKTPSNRGLVEDNNHSIKLEQETDDLSNESVNNEKNHHENNVAICDIKMKVEENNLQVNAEKDREKFASESTSTERSLKDKVKEESILTENNCDISVDSTESPSIIESVEELQEVGKNLIKREPQIFVESSEMRKKENLKTSHEVCLISDSSVSGFSDIIVDHEEQEQNKKHFPPLVNLESCDENKLSGFQSKMSTPQDIVIIDESPVTPRLKMSVGQPSTSNNSLQCEVEITDICSTKESGVASRTKNRNTVGGQKSSIKKSVKCEIDITDVSSAEESTNDCPGISGNKGGDDILCVSHKHKPKRKRRISHRKSSVKSEKSYVVDVETDTLMHSDNNVVPRKVAKREKQKEISEVIVVDDTDTHCDSDEAIVLKDDDMELELIKFYEEITLIDLTGEDSNTKTRAEILDMFPNFAGVKIATVRVPPSELLPENVTPSQQEYQIDLQKLLSDRPEWIVRRRPYRGRGAHQRFRQRRGYFQRQHYRGAPHRHMTDERNYVDPHAMSEEFSRNVRMEYDGHSASQNYSTPYGYPPQENVPFAVIDTSGDFSRVRRFEHHQRFPQTRSNQQWYENTWNAGPPSDAFMQRSDSPASYPLPYDHMNVDNRFAGDRHHQQRWNRRHNRNPSNRRTPSGRTRFRSHRHPAPHRHTPRTVNVQEETTEYDWQNIRNVSENAENWSHFKQLLSGNNCEEPTVEPKLETSMKVEANDDGSVKLEAIDDGSVKVEVNAGPSVKLEDDVDGGEGEEEEDDDDEDDDEEEEEEEGEEADDDEDEWKPLLQPSDCTDIGSILQKLNIFKEIVCDKIHIPHSQTRLKINYDIYLPTTKFKKSSPCVPDYRLCVVGCEEEVPSAGEISFLLKELKNDIPVPLLFAVVVPDSVSFYHFVNISLPVDDSCPD